MKRFELLSLLLLIFLAVFSESSAEDQKIITLEGDVWPPYVMDPADGRQGFIVAVAAAALARSGYEVRYSHTPWTRALKETEEGKTDGAVGIYFTEAVERNFVVPEEEIGVSVNKFYIIKESTWQYSGVQSLGTITLGIIDGYDYGEINTYLNNQRNIKSSKVDVAFGDRALEKNLQKLLAGRIDATVEDQLVVANVSSSLGIKEKIKEGGTSGPAHKVGVAFSPNNPLSAEYAKALSAGIIALRLSGELQQILDGYEVKDWK